MRGLADRTWSLLNQVLDAYSDSPRATHWLRGHLARFSEPVRLAVAGPPGSGRTTLVTALGQQPELNLLDAPPIEADPEPGAMERLCMESDAVLYLMGHPHNADLAFLRAMQDHPVARAAPVASLAVLARADELGGGRVDAVVSARQVARRYRRDAELGPLCQDVVAVAGLAASAAQTFGEADFETLAALASVPKEELEPLLLSVDRFAGEPAREELLSRFGLFGVRLATMLLRRGADTPAALATQLLQRTGLTELREAIGLYFTDRAPVLKARSALMGIEVVLRMEPRPAAAPLVAELERILAGAHEFRELRLLSALRAGRARLPDELREEAIRLIGGHGSDPGARLGVGASGPEVADAAAGAVRLWREYAENPVLGAAERRAASVVIRSCEGLLTGH
ncbi:hypothetical protein [Prauserella muralis]|uniref:Uncharacterized protein n=1 Tax=Prauserella muralis TaxID=588067 RepID=A0A2V4B7R0_9PSEU|nr:hypothetical protein [Prauserella muralis]PXY31288.1 hypothetical protein BAY60_02480 [Prauserella muralis]TWE14401.1 hypothetical protein FHX69_6547 [Prauserella muralis]